MVSKTILSVRNLAVNFYTYRGVVKALDGVDFDVKRGEQIGLVGETGCGKTVTALSVMKLVPPPGRIVSGHILFNGVDLVSLTEEEMNKVRGRKISMIFQDPLSHLNPVYKIGEQIADVIMLHQKLEGRRRNIKKNALKKAIEALKLVKMPEPEVIANKYPHELSGGMRQRVLIAMAISCNPELLIADEPTTALDVTVQAHILDLLKDLKKKLNLTVLFITHDLGIVAQTCERVAVMYAGCVVEVASTRKIFKNPLHPYTKGLLEAIPKLHEEKFLKPIPGSIPDLINPPRGCRFHPRCKCSLDKCRFAKPEMLEVEEGHYVACHKWR